MDTSASSIAASTSIKNEPSAEIEAEKRGATFCTPQPPRNMQAVSMSPVSYYDQPVQRALAKVPRKNIVRTIPIDPSRIAGSTHRGLQSVLMASMATARNAKSISFGGATTAAAAATSVTGATFTTSATLNISNSSVPYQPSADTAAIVDMNTPATSDMQSNNDVLLSEGSIAAQAPSTGNTKNFRRKKVIPVVVAQTFAKKAAKNTTSAAEKVAGEQEEPHPDLDSARQKGSEEVIETVTSTAPSTDPVNPAKLNEQTKQTPVAKPSAFRRIKPKVSILPVAKSARAIPKKSNPSKEFSAETSVKVKSGAAQKTFATHSETDAVNDVVATVEECLKPTEHPQVSPSNAIVDTPILKTVAATESQKCLNAQTTVASPALSPAIVDGDVDKSPVKARETVPSDAVKEAAGTSKLLLDRSIEAVVAPAQSEVDNNPPADAESALPDKENLVDVVLESTKVAQGSKKVQQSEESWPLSSSNSNRSTNDDQISKLPTHAPSPATSTATTVGTPVSGNKTIKRTISLGKLPPELAKKLKLSLSQTASTPRRSNEKLVNVTETKADSNTTKNLTNTLGSDGTTVAAEKSCTGTVRSVDPSFHHPLDRSRASQAADVLTKPVPTVIESSSINYTPSTAVVMAPSVANAVQIPQTLKASKEVQASSCTGQAPTESVAELSSALPAASSNKQIRKVHYLSASQKQLFMQCLSKGKQNNVTYVPTAAKEVSSANEEEKSTPSTITTSPNSENVTETNLATASVDHISSIKQESQMDSFPLSTDITSSAPSASQQPMWEQPPCSASPLSPSQPEKKVEIISQIILPKIKITPAKLVPPNDPLPVLSTSGAPLGSSTSSAFATVVPRVQTNVESSNFIINPRKNPIVPMVQVPLILSKDGRFFHIPLQGTPGTSGIPGAPLTYPGARSEQYPKILVLHRPAPSTASVSSIVSANTAPSISQSVPATIGPIPTVPKIVIDRSYVGGQAQELIIPQSPVLKQEYSFSQLAKSESNAGNVKSLPSPKKAGCSSDVRHKLRQKAIRNLHDRGQSTDADIVAKRPAATEPLALEPVKHNPANRYGRSYPGQTTSRGGKQDLTNIPQRLMANDPKKAVIDDRQEIVGAVGHSESLWNTVRKCSPTENAPEMASGDSSSSDSSSNTINSSIDASFEQRNCSRDSGDFCGYSNATLADDESKMVEQIRLINGAMEQMLKRSTSMKHEHDEAEASSNIANYDDAIAAHDQGDHDPWDAGYGPYQDIKPIFHNVTEKGNVQVPSISTLEMGIPQITSLSAAEMNIAPLQDTEEIDINNTPIVILSDNADESFLLPTPVVQQEKPAFRGSSQPPYFAVMPSTSSVEVPSFRTTEPTRHDTAPSVADAIEDTLVEDDATTNAKEWTAVDAILAEAAKQNNGRNTYHSDSDSGTLPDDSRSERSTKDLIPNIGPSDSSSDESGKACREKVYEEKRDDLVDLLLRHVNYESLFGELVEQQRLKYGLVNSLPVGDESRDGSHLSPLERYLKTKKLPPSLVNEDDDDGLDRELFERVLKPYVARTHRSNVQPEIQKDDFVPTSRATVSSLDPTTQEDLTRVPRAEARDGEISVTEQISEPTKSTLPAENENNVIVQKADVDDETPTAATIPDDADECPSDSVLHDITPETTVAEKRGQKRRAKRSPVADRSLQRRAKDDTDIDRDWDLEIENASITIDSQEQHSDADHDQPFVKQEVVDISITDVVAMREETSDTAPQCSLSETLEVKTKTLDKEASEAMAAPTNASTYIDEQSQSISGAVDESTLLSTAVCRTSKHDRGTTTAVVKNFIDIIQQHKSVNSQKVRSTKQSPVAYRAAMLNESSDAIRDTKEKVDQMAPSVSARLPTDLEEIVKFVIEKPSERTKRTEDKAVALPEDTAIQQQSADVKSPDVFSEVATKTKTNLAADAEGEPISSNPDQKTQRRGRKRTAKRSPVAIAESVSSSLHDSEQQGICEVVSDCSSAGFSNFEDTLCEGPSNSQSVDSPIPKETVAELTMKTARKQSAAKSSRNNESHLTSASRTLRPRHSSTPKPAPKRRGRPPKATGSTSDHGGGADGEAGSKAKESPNATERARSVAAVETASHSKGRGRKSRRDNSCSSISSSSSSISRTRNSGPDDGGGGDVTSDDSLPGDRHRQSGAGTRCRKKVLRKKRQLNTPSKPLIDIVRKAGLKITVAVPTEKSASPVASATSATDNSKPSNPDEQYVISEIVEPALPGNSQPASERILEVINVRTNHVFPADQQHQVPFNQSNTLLSASQPTLESTSPPAPAPKARGRKPKRCITVVPIAAQSPPIPKAVIKQESGVEETVTPDDAGPAYQCGKCSKTIPHPDWDAHYNLHNGLTFRVGLDQALDLNDFNLVAGQLLRFMKLNRRTELECEACGDRKKSHLGMASHLSTCGFTKEELEARKVSCEHCNRRMLAISLPAHLASFCRVLKSRQMESLSMAKAQAAVEQDRMDQELNASGRLKRQSVACAEQKIKKIAEDMTNTSKELILQIAPGMVSPGTIKLWQTQLQFSKQPKCCFDTCTFTAGTEKELVAHHGQCPLGVQKRTETFFECAICCQFSSRREVIRKHVMRCHSKEMALLSASESGGDSDRSDGAPPASESGTDDNTSLSSGVPEDEDEMRLEKRSKTVGGKRGARGGQKSRAVGRKKPGTETSRQGGNKSIDTMDGEPSYVVDDSDVYRDMVLEEANEYRMKKTVFHVTCTDMMTRFRKVHYSTPLLFEHLLPDVDVRFLAMLSTRDYLPRSGQSMRFRVRSVSSYDTPYSDSLTEGWQQLPVFQAKQLTGHESVLFCGGPVTAIDWLPVPDLAPDSAADQIMALACKSNFADSYNCEQLALQPQRKCLIQIWNVGPLQNKDLNRATPVRSPQLTFAIACDFGPIWQLAFCPSGCYNERLKGDRIDRLGLLAATGSDGDVYMFALSRSMVSVPAGTTSAATAAPRVVHLQPVLRLSLTLTVHGRSAGLSSSPATDFTGHSVVKLAWTRAQGHGAFAAGFSNGVVAVWNLETRSPLLTGVKNGIRTILPTHKMLHTNNGAVTALDLHYAEATRFLVVCNADRRLKVYDLHSGRYQPLEVCNIVTRSRCTAVRWLVHFPVLTMIYDDSYALDRCGYTIHQPREIGLRMFPLCSIGAEATDMSANEWLGTNMFATDGGDLLCHRPIAFVCNTHERKSTHMLTSTETIRLDDNTDDLTDLSSYETFSGRFGLLFSDTDGCKNKTDTKSLQVKSLRRAPFGQYSATRITQVCFNPNSSSYQYYAIGYQAGFVRIRGLRL